MRRPAPDVPARRPLATGRPAAARLDALDLPSRRDLLHDVVAGLTVGASQVGNAMAYTMLAGVPPVHGLYAVDGGHACRGAHVELRAHADRADRGAVPRRRRRPRRSCRRSSASPACSCSRC